MIDKNIKGVQFSLFNDEITQKITIYESKKIKKIIYKDKNYASMLKDCMKN